MANTADFFNDVLEDKATILFPGQGETLSVNGGSMVLKITSPMSKDQLGLYEITLPPRTIGAQLHYHRFMDEAFIVTKGVLTVGFMDGEKAAPEGTVIYVPRFTPHGFRNNSDEPVTMLLLFTPGQNREGFFRGLKEVLSVTPIDPARFLQLYNKYDSFPVDAQNMLPAKMEG